MLTFNQAAYQQTLKTWGIEKSLYPYKELLTSESAYVNHFLYYLNDDNMKELLAVYEGRYFRLREGELSQEQLRLIFDSLKVLRDKQKGVIEVLYSSDPQQWLLALENLKEDYQQYIKFTSAMVVPAKVDLKFKEIQAVKMKADYPQLGSLGAVLISPVQRLPRYSLLGKELLKAVDPLIDNSSNFKQDLSDFVNGVKKINIAINESMALEHEPVQELPDDEPSSPYFEPSGRLHPVSTDYQLSRHLAQAKRLRRAP